jgi:pyrroloquinoline quinone (PQQ) biosynthesis protein C
MTEQQWNETAETIPTGYAPTQAPLRSGTLHDRYGARRVYKTDPTPDGGIGLVLSDRVVELGQSEYAAYARVVEWLPTIASEADLQAATAMDPPRLDRFLARLAETGLLYERAALPAVLTGTEFYKIFDGFLPGWLGEAFSHPYWDRMLSGRGSTRLFAGWMIELYHYTRNANRHMPLACAHGHTIEKTQRALHARHYAEEWNHYNFFLKSLKELGYEEAAILTSVPLPLTLALSNFMRQAAREDILCYSICSAVLEGTTVDSRSYNTYYEKSIAHYNIPRAVIQPIYSHLDLDLKYQHKNLFEEILRNTPAISAARASKILNYGQGLVEAIWMWTDNIEKYYEDENNQVPRQPVDPFLD